jgi:hypothetical protein
LLAEKLSHIPVALLLASILLTGFLMFQTLHAKEIDQVKRAFIENKHPRFKKEFAVSRHQPFGKTSDYVKCIENSYSEKIAQLTKLVGMPLETKAYMFWREK